MRVVTKEEEGENQFLCILIPRPWDLSIDIYYIKASYINVLRRYL